MSCAAATDIELKVWKWGGKVCRGKTAMMSCEMANCRAAAVSLESLIAADNKR